MTDDANNRKPCSGGLAPTRPRSTRRRKTLLRAVLLVAYMVISLFVGAFFRGGGHGSYAPPAILYGWGIVPWQLDLAPGEFGFWVIPNASLVGLFLAVTTSIRANQRIAQLAPVGLHMVGVVVAAVHVEHGHLAKDWWLVASYIVPALIAAGYLASDWHLAILARRPPPADG